MTTCRYDREAETYVTDDGSECRRDDYGDPTWHCQARKTCSLHVGPDERTCNRCLNRARTDLRQIIELAPLLMPAALTSGIDSDAVSLAGPTADVEAWSWRKVAARQGKSWHLSLIEDDDDLHPESLLERWQWMISEDYGDERVGGITAAGAYLDRRLHRIAQDDTQDFRYLRRQLKSCRAHVETVIRNSKTPQRGAPCPDCLADGKVIRLSREWGHWCEDAECERIHYLDDSGDRWVCPRNRAHAWSHRDYENWIEERQQARAGA